MRDVAGLELVNVCRVCHSLLHMCFAPSLKLLLQLLVDGCMRAAFSLRVMTANLLCVVLSVVRWYPHHVIPWGIQGMLWVCSRAAALSLVRSKQRDGPQP